MSLFTSKRERRFWLLALAVIVGVYASVGVVRPISEFLRAAGLSTALFILGMILIGITVLTQGLKVRPRGAEIGVGLGITAVYLMMFNRIALLEERTHLMEYGVLAVFIYEALTERSRQGRRVPVPALLAVLLTALLGWIDEGIQAFLPSRFYDNQDVLFNTVAAVMAIAASAALSWARQRYGKARTD